MLFLEYLQSELWGYFANQIRIFIWKKCEIEKIKKTEQKWFVGVKKGKVTPPGLLALTMVRIT
jgi:hypothetical protein